MVVFYFSHRFLNSIHKQVLKHINNNTDNYNTPLTLTSGQRKHEQKDFKIKISALAVTLSVSY